MGFFIGILPGPATVISAFASYAVEKKLSKYPERFGTGVIEGVAGPESANNAATGGAFIPLFTLGIPCNPVVAILLGAFMIYGIQPGPMMISKYPDIFWATVMSMYLGNVMLLVLNLPLIGLWVQVLKVPYPILFPHHSALLSRRGFQPELQLCGSGPDDRLRRLRLSGPGSSSTKWRPWSWPWSWGR